MLKKIANAVARSKNALAEETQHILCGVVFFTNQTNMPFSVVFLLGTFLLLDLLNILIWKNDLSACFAVSFVFLNGDVCIQKVWCLSLPLHAFVLFLIP